MRVRRARPDEAEQCWLVRNLAIRDGCRNSYKPEILQAWTPDGMPENYREIIRANPFFVVEGPDSRPVATGFLDLSSGSVEAVFTVPEHAGKGLAGKIIEAIKGEARQRGLTRLTLASTPNAQTFYERHGFSFVQENVYPSRLAQAELRCIDMAIAL
ncbi:MAG: GNAT family N-acetyltransferase [Pantoea sp.]|uniref:GNAT family N-acetyltransferase n=1 Tax=Pantoea septica TaxID=472695 RepID=UPI000E931A7F|nr:GNAT family N-acetyltransferase [Pantoea septica]MDU5836996.1 GNAT family N-acetyltransferase [Pantoea sp.]MDU6441544.1 GNAT family N-acetyltransferase [Pantoea sp.]HAT24337.1 N-acetyltransferase [Pantoea septica]